MLQLQLFKPTKDIECPSYKKVYSVYAYDRLKYMMIWKKIQELAIRFNDINIFKRVSPYRVLKLCYVYDEDGQKQSNGDKKHIYRVAVLQRLYDKLFSLTINERHIKLIKYFEERQAEIADTIDLSIKDKIHLHIKLIKLLKNGVNINDAMSEVLYG